MIFPQRDKGYAHEQGRVSFARSLQGMPRIYESNDVSTLFRTQTPIGFQSLLIGQRGEVAIRRMAPLAIVEHLNVFEHRRLGLLVRVKVLQIN